MPDTETKDLKAAVLELVDDLPGALEAWPAAEGDDDVTELTLKRTAARELHAPEEVAIHLEEIVAGERDARHVGALRLLVAGAVPSGPPVGKELGVHERLEDLLQLRTIDRATLRIEERLRPDLREHGLAFAVRAFMIQMRTIGVGGGFPRA